MVPYLKEGKLAQHVPSIEAIGPYPLSRQRPAKGYLSEFSQWLDSGRIEEQKVKKVVGSPNDDSSISWLIKEKNPNSKPAKVEVDPLIFLEFIDCLNLKPEEVFHHRFIHFLDKYGPLEPLDEGAAPPNNGGQSLNLLLGIEARGSQSWVTKWFIRAIFAHDIYYNSLLSRRATSDSKRSSGISRRAAVERVARLANAYLKDYLPEDQYCCDRVTGSLSRRKFAASLSQYIFLSLDNELLANGLELRFCKFCSNPFWVGKSGLNKHSNKNREHCPPGADGKEKCKQAYHDARRPKGNLAKKESKVVKTKNKTSKHGATKKRVKEKGAPNAKKNT